MAQYITMKQVPGGTVTAVDDRILYDTNLHSGVIYGCEISYLGNNMIHINAGYGVIKGGLFEMEDHTEYVDYAESAPTTGQIYLKFDAAAVDKLVIVKETTSTLHVLEQDDNANFDSGVYEIQLCTFTATTTALESVTQTFPEASGAVDILDTLAEIEANVSPNKVAGALAVKQLNNNLGNINISVNDDGKLVWTDKDGADTVLPFSSKITGLIELGRAGFTTGYTGYTITANSNWKDCKAFIVINDVARTVEAYGVSSYTNMTRILNMVGTSVYIPTGNGTPTVSVANGSDTYFTVYLYGLK